VSCMECHALEGCAYHPVVLTRKTCLSWAETLLFDHCCSLLVLHSCDVLLTVSCCARLPAVCAPTALLQSASSPSTLCSALL
jgi:hypothetical protein